MSPLVFMDLPPVGVWVGGLEVLEFSYLRGVVGGGVVLGSGAIRVVPLEVVLWVEPLTA